MKQAKKRRLPQTAQQTIPYQRMWPDGICRVTDHYYTKTMRFYDVNYQLAQNEDKEAIFAAWSDVLNYFSPDMRVQLSFVNTVASEAAFEQSVILPPQDDGFDDVREEYTRMLLDQVAKGNNGLQRAKYITFGIDAESIKAAKPRLGQIELDLRDHFKRLGVRAEPLDGKDRLQLMHAMFHMDDPQAQFMFDWKWLVPSGLSTKDFIAPSSLYFKDSRRFFMGGSLASVSFLQILASEMDDLTLVKLLGLDSGQVITMHIQPMDQVEAIKLVKRKITDLNRSKIDEQKKAVRSGYDIDILPSDLNTYAADYERLLQDLQNHNERMFLLTFLVMHTAQTRRELDNILLQARGIVQEKLCQLVPLDYQQEEGLVSSLPLGLNQIEITRSITTTATAIFMPFVTQELFQANDKALYYGLNGLSNNLIMADRRALKNPNGLILGTPGSGKSFAAKREIANAFLATRDDIIICDPEGEYFPLVERLGGQVIRISPTSSDHINPLDINANYSDEEEPLRLKSDFVLSLCVLILGGRDSIGPREKSVIDRALKVIYRPYFANPSPDKMPVLGDLYSELLKMTEPEAASVATALELYVTGSLNVFNHRTDVELNNRLVCFDVKQLGNQLKKLGMLVIQDQVWNRVTMNRAMRKTTWYYVDEFHLLLREPQTAAYSIEIWKRFRKWGGVPTGITQNVKDLLASSEIESIFENSEFIMMLNQAAGDRAELGRRLNLSKDQLARVTQVDEGEGLLFYGNVVIPFADHFPRDTELYSIMTTKPDEMKQEGATS